MRTFIFTTTIKKENDKVKLIVVGMVQSDMYPSGLTRDKDSKFYGCACHEISESCHVEIGTFRQKLW